MSIPINHGHCPLLFITARRSFSSCLAWASHPLPLPPLQPDLKHASATSASADEDDPVVVRVVVRAVIVQPEQRVRRSALICPPG